MHTLDSLQRKRVVLLMLCFPLGGGGLFQRVQEINIHCLVQMSAAMMKNMSKEDLAKMQSMAGGARAGGATGPMQSGAGMPGMGGAGAPSSMAEMLDNPEAMKTAMNMMKKMDKGQIKNMLKMSQPGALQAVVVQVTRHICWHFCFADF